MRTLLLTLALILACTTTAPAAEPLFSGPVYSVVYRDADDSVDSFTRGDRGVPGTSSDINVDVWVTIHPQWVMIELKKRNVMHIIPADRVLRIDVDTKRTAGSQE